LIKTFDEVKFEIERENWNEYELIEGSHRVTLRMRAVLTKILKPKIMKMKEPPMIGVPEGMQPPLTAPTQELQLNFQNIVVVSECPAILMGKPTPPISPSELNKIATEEVEVHPFNEEWNIYKTEDNVTLKIKLIVSSVRRAKGKFDKLGYPFYVVQSTNAIVPSPPKSKK
jgi:hypothetical protein